MNVGGKGGGGRGVIKDQKPKRALKKNSENLGIKLPMYLWFQWCFGL